MKTEKIIDRESSRCLNVAANEVTSLRINNKVENTVRVYDKGCIGVEGRLGKADLDEMSRSAQEKLQQGIAYPETHDEAIVMDVDSVKEILKEEQFVSSIKGLVARLAKENPEFIFSNKVLLNSSQSTYQNSDGTSLSYKGNQLLLEFALKYKGSANIMDEFYGCESDYFNEDEICRDVKSKCDAFLKELPHVEQDEVTVIGDFEPLQYAMQHLLADLYFNKASLFDGKLGQKVFHEKLNIRVNRDPKEQLNLPFFDAEGVVNRDFVNYMIKGGVIERLLTCKKSASDYGVENLGSASANYDGVPSFGIGGLEVENTAENLSDLVQGTAVYVTVTGGGDMTPSGDFSLPVIVSYLYRDSELMGRLPGFTVSGNIFSILGDGFIGVTNKGIERFGKRSYFVYRAKLVNKT